MKLSGIVFVMGGFVVVAALIPSARNAIQSKVNDQDRRVLAVQNMMVGDSGKVNRFVKVLTPEGITVEFYHGDSMSNVILKDSYVLQGHGEARYELGGKMVNLAFEDLSENPGLELLVPTLNPKQRVHLQVFALDLKGHTLEPIFGPFSRVPYLEGP